ncbi:hypothetical protein EYF80_006179 [Liparis tanakae]|uniref:Uncharacterized protein n=1 Tax=Liparis tanakae TaxID=230148 RepID=A0A4Z2J135_9TELE|nr:hypothetical protein EYF80_006179 [Liparis tanakae]
MFPPCRLGLRWSRTVMVDWTGPGLRIRLPDLASASESETGVHHALTGKELGKAKGPRQEKCVGALGVRVSTSLLIRAHSVVLVRTSWSELALQEMVAPG